MRKYQKGGRSRSRSRNRIGNREGSSISFLQAMKKARNAIRHTGKKKGVLENAKIAYQSLIKSGSPSRIIAIPKKGEFLPLIPLYAALAALGSLAGGAAAITKAVNAAKAERDQLAEAKRHNLAIESTAVGKGLYMKPYKAGCGLSIGSGLYIRPYKAGCVVYMTSGDVSKYG